MISKILVRAPEYLKNILQSYARQHGATLNQLVLQILWEWVKHNPPAPEERGGGHE